MTTMTTHPELETLTLETIEGPPTETIEIPRDSGAIIGRADTCELTLPDPTVSRRHAEVVFDHGHWFITDLESRHGTFLNATRLERGVPTGLKCDDLIRIEPWTLRVRDVERPSSTVTLSDAHSDSDRVERVSPRELRSIADHRIGLLLEFANAIHSADDEAALSRIVLEAALKGSGFSRAALIRPLGGADEFQVIDHRAADGSGSEVPRFSRSLVRAAADGRTVRLLSVDESPASVSVIQLGIHSASCAPVYLGRTIASYLYLDSRGGESPAHADASAFCQAISRLCGLALANLKRQDLENRHQELRASLDAAHEAQQFIFPAEHGTVGGVQYAVRMRPGLIVAGDLFDVVPLDDGKVAVCFGDVTGEGIGAGILMAITQSCLHGSLQRFGTPEAAVNNVNRYITAHSIAGRFVTLWVGVFDIGAGQLHYVDAGHGHWMIKSEGQPPIEAPRAQAIPIGIDPSLEYQARTMELQPSQRIILFSDGLIEQRSPDGEQFGHDRIVQTLTGTRSASQDVAVLFDALDQFAGGKRPSDDTSVASIEVGS